MTDMDRMLLDHLVGAKQGCFRNSEAKRLADPYAPGRTTWWKVLNRAYSQKAGRSELFERP